MNYADSGYEYLWAWPDWARGTEHCQNEATYYVDLITARPGRAAWYGSKALKWGASPEQVAQALSAIRTQQDTWLDGVLQGQTAAEGNTEVLLEARMVWSSQAVGFEGALNMANFAAGASGPRTRLAVEEAHRRILWACGVREGFKLSTAQRPDAHECAMCDERVLSDSDELAVQCEDHGWFCTPECRNLFCRPTCVWPEP